MSPPALLTAWPVTSCNVNTQFGLLTPALLTAWPVTSCNVNTQFGLLTPALLTAWPVTSCNVNTQFGLLTPALLTAWPVTCCNVNTQFGLLTPALLTLSLGCQLQDCDTGCRSCCIAGCLFNVPATCCYISGTDLLRQLCVLPHRDRSCRQKFLPHQSQYTDTGPTSSSVATGVTIFKSLV